MAKLYTALYTCKFGCEIYKKIARNVNNQYRCICLNILCLIRILDEQPHIAKYNIELSGGQLKSTTRRRKPGYSPSTNRFLFIGLYLLKFIHSVV